MSITGSEQWMYSSGREFYDFPIEQSLRFNNPDQPRLTRSVTHNRKTFTINFWFKRANLGRYWLYGVYSNSATTANLNFESDGTLTFYDYLSAYRFRLVTSRVFRDVGTWYCITLSVDTTQSTASDRVKLFVNGVQETSFSTATYPSQNLDLKFGDGSTHAIGTEGTNNRLWWDGYLADWNLIDGQALDATSFGEFKSGIWTPVDTSGLTFGSGGYRLQFGDSAAIGDDTSGNTNDWTVNNLVASDVVLDSPTNNFATMNILDDNYASPKFSYSEGNLKYTYGYTGAGFDRVFGSIAISPNDTNKYYFEFTGNVNNEQMQWGVVSTDSLAYSVADRDNGLSATANASQLRWVSYLSAPYLYRIDSSTTGEGTLLTTSNGNAANGDIYSLVYDADAGKFYAWFNGVEFTGQNYAAGTSLWATMDTSKTYMVMMYQGDGGVTTKSGNMTANFGQDSSFSNAKVRQGNTDANGLGDFYYPVPDGALALCTANLPQGAIDTLNDETPEDYFNTVLYTGNGTGQSITTGHASDFVWLKARALNYQHSLYDSVRGGQYRLASDQALAEVSDASANLQSFDADGFTVGTLINENQSGQSYVGWSWKAGGTAVSNTDGSITSTVSVGATSQQNWFSVVSWEGTGANATVGHGLDGTVPEMIVAKRRNTSGSWGVYHSGMTSATYQMWLNFTNGQTSRPAQWNSTAPTSSVFSIGTDTDVNASGSDYIAYCFANADGLCKVGSYVGGSAFVYTGFRPAFVLIKKASGGTFASGQSDWVLYDGVRNPSNPTDLELVPNSSQAEDTYGSGGEDIDMLSNGFKILTSSSQITGTSTYEYIYLAIASQGFKYANAR